MCLQQADTQAPARNWLWVRGVFQATCDPSCLSRGAAKNLFPPQRLELPQQNPPRKGWQGRECQT